MQSNAVKMYSMYIYLKRQEKYFFSQGACWRAAIQRSAANAVEGR